MLQSHTWQCSYSLLVRALVAQAGVAWFTSQWLSALHILLFALLFTWVCHTGRTRVGTGVYLSGWLLLQLRLPWKFSLLLQLQLLSLGILRKDKILPRWNTSWKAGNALSLSLRSNVIESLCQYSDVNNKWKWPGLLMYLFLPLYISWKLCTSCWISAQWLCLFSHFLILYKKKSFTGCLGMKIGMYDHNMKWNQQYTFMYVAY